MSEQPNGNTLELKRIARMLEKTVEMAQDAELTGSLAEKSAAAVRTYNKTVGHLSSLGQISTALFSPLPEDASLTDVAMSSAQLAEYLRAGLPEEEQEHRGAPSVTRNMVISNLDLRGSGDKDELAQMIREHLAEYFGETKQGAASPEAESADTMSSPASAAQPNREPAATPRRAALPSQARVEELRTDAPAEVRRQ
jgi:hypothetical protein